MMMASRRTHLMMSRSLPEAINIGTRGIDPDDDGDGDAMGGD